MPTAITSAADLAVELNRLADRLEESADDLQRTKPGDKPARGKLANEYAVLAGDRLLRAAQDKAIRDRQLLAHLDVEHPNEGQRRNLAFLHAVQRWLPAVSPDHRPDKHNVARRYADDLRALAAAICTSRTDNTPDNRPWNGPTTQNMIAIEFGRVSTRTVRRWASHDIKGPVEVEKRGSKFYWRPWPE